MATSAAAPTGKSRRQAQAKRRAAATDGNWSDDRSAAGKRNAWLIVGIISIATFMEVLDSSIANVALQHIAGSLSVSVDEATWVVTSYLVANAIVIPISGWLASVVGRKRYYMISVALFAISSLMCGLSPNLAFLIAARIFQGIGGGGLAPSEQSILADTFPPSKRGQAFAAYGVVVVVGPILGPTLGGYITDNISWHWIFLINVPIGLISLLLTHFFVCEPKILEKERKERLKGGLNLDYIGFALIALGLGCLEVTLDRGERDDWFSSSFITTNAILAGSSLVLLIFWELCHKNPMVNLRLFANRNFSICCLFMMTAGLIIFGSTQLIPQMLQQVQGYTATEAGLALTSGGVVALLAMPLVGFLSGKVDVRALLFPALVVQGIALWYLSRLSPDLAFSDAARGRLFQSLALPFLFVPVNAAAYVGINPKRTNEASALLNVARNLGGTIGISPAQSFLQNQEQVHQSQMVEGLNPLNPSYNQGIGLITQQIAGRAHDLGQVAASQMGVPYGQQATASGQGMMTASGVLYQQVQNQAAMLSYIDVFHVFMIVVLMIAPLALVLRPAKPGAAPAGH